MADEWRVRILGRDGLPAGAGVYLPGNRILTAAHVVSKATGSPDPTTRPRGGVLVDFTTTLSTGPVHAQIEHGVPPGQDGGEDFAVLRLAEQPPGAIAARVSRVRLGEDQSVRAYGYPDGHDLGLWARLEIAGTGGPRDRWVQLNQVGTSVGPFGFSGAGVVSEESGAVIGIVVAAQARGGLMWMVSMDTIATVWPPLAPLLDRQPSEVVRRLVDAALRIRVMHDTASRDLILAELPDQISGTVRRHPAARLDVTSIIRACLPEPGGLRTLAAVLEFLDGGSGSVLEFRHLVDEIDPPTTRSPADPSPGGPAEYLT